MSKPNLVGMPVNTRCLQIYHVSYVFVCGDRHFVEYMYILFLSRRESLTLLAQCSITTKVKALRI